MVCPGKAGRRHADHRERMPVQHHRASENLRVAAKAPNPDVVAEHHNLIASQNLIFLRPDGAAQREIEAEQRKINAAHQLSPNALGLLRAADAGG